MLGKTKFIYACQNLQCACPHSVLVPVYNVHLTDEIMRPESDQGTTVSETNNVQPIHTSFTYT